MMDTKTLVNSAVATVFALGLTAGATSAMAAKPEMEKCFGVVKAGMNDCGSSQHACAGQAKTNSDREEWVYLPKGTCDKIVGGKLKMASK